LRHHFGRDRRADRYAEDRARRDRDLTKAFERQMRQCARKAKGCGQALLRQVLPKTGKGWNRALSK